MEKNKKIDRAAQFLPFNALRGYYDLVHKEEIVVSPKRALSDDELDNLSRTIQKVKKGSIIEVNYYKDTGYVSLEGMVSNIDPVNRTITIVKKTISLDDILKIKLC